jgi:ribosomal protein L37E
MSNFGSGKLVHCNKCGWTQFEVSKEYALDWEQEWQHYFDTKPKEWLASYGAEHTPPKAKTTYCNCFRCGGSYKDFLDGACGKFMNGSTTQPILKREDDL